MYPVSEQFLQTIRQPVIDYYVDGTIGSVEFDESNIVTGSFHIQNQCTDTSDVVLGSVFTGSLTATFYGLNIPRYSWVGKVITPTFYLHVGNTWQHVPLGVYTIKEAKHSAEGVEIIAYDDMIKLDKKFKASKFKTAQKMYQHLTTICTACGLTLGMTEQEIQALPNGNTNLGIVGTKSNKYLSYKKYSNDIDTYRDLVFWIAQSMGTFATINRDGELVFRKYKKTTQAVDEITESYRLAGAVFDDFTTNYTGIYVTNTKDGEEIYYGYDVDELTTAIADTEAAIAENEGERMALWTQYQQGEITEQEYKAAVKPLEKRWKNLEKQLDWLNQALVKAQNEEDGLFMDLGENPILQPDGIGSTYAAMRKRVLKALDAISYTPFTCSTVVGVHYDLGDIIQFTGGHATEIGETCCMMAYDFNLNGEFQMQGFGSDPSKPVIKNKNSKKADKADKNGVSSSNISTGATTPDSGNNGDLHLTTGGAQEAAQQSAASSFHNFTVTNENGSFNITAEFHPDAISDVFMLKVDGFTEGETVSGSFDFGFPAGTDFYFNDMSHTCFVSFESTPTNYGYPTNDNQGRFDAEHRVQYLYWDTVEHTYSFDFVAPSSTIYIVCSLGAPVDYQTIDFAMTDFVLSGGAVSSMSYCDDNGNWVNIDYVRKVKQIQTSGTKIATAENSDGTDTDIYVPNMTGAGASTAGSNGLVPAPASGDNEKFLRGDGTWQTAGGGNDVGLSVGSNGAIQSTYTDGTEQTEDILRDDTGGDIVTLLNSIAIALQSAAINVESVNVNYSTDEQIIGTWIDEKPLYEKTVEVDNINGIVYTVTNGKMVLINEAYGVYNVSGTLQYLNLNYYYSSSDRCTVYTRGNDVYAEVTNTFKFYYTKLLLKLRYTKTTD